MLGTMMDVPMLLSRLIDHAADNHGDVEIVARSVLGEIERETWRGMRWRSKRLAEALNAYGHGHDSCIGSLAWNTLDHIELFYGSLGIGAGLHTLNPRLTPDDLRYMIEKVGEDIVFIDAATLELAEKLAPLVPGVTRWVFMGKGIPRQTSLPGFITKADIVSNFDGTFVWPEFDERQAATICFTSGTTGRPKGVVYSHRSITLGAMNMSMADMYATTVPGRRECVMPIAPIFHANGWMMPFTAPMNGHKLVLPGRSFDPVNVIELIRREAVTLAAAVPTVWMDVLDHADAAGLDLPSLRTGLLAGSRPSQDLADRLAARGIAMCQSWGMTEVPGASRASLPLGTDQLPLERRAAMLRDYQGRAGFQVEMRLVDGEGIEVPRDGLTPGHLFVRGPSVAAGYLGDEADSAGNWLDTGDIATIAPGGMIQIVDRSKDVIKSGGEWISTLQLEAAACTHPAVRQAAAISIPHPRWQERPLLLCTVIDGETIDLKALRVHMAQHVAKWWLPDEIRVIDTMPLTSTGKIDKMVLRAFHLSKTVINS